MCKAKFTKKAFRLAIRTSNQSEVWHLASVKLGRTPTKKEVCDLVETIANTKKGYRKAYALAYTSYRKSKLNVAIDDAWWKRGGYRQYDTRHYRTVALQMLRDLAMNPVTSYTKVPMFGMNHLYFCSPTYGHADYNKRRTCLLTGPLATDSNGNKYDPQAVWCEKVVEIGNRIYARKSA